MPVWKTNLKDGRKATLRFLTADDKDKLFRMFSSMSEKALRWSAAPYNLDIIERWVKNLPDLIAIVAEYEETIVGYAVIYKFPQQHRKGLGDLAVYLHQSFHNVGLGTAMTEKLLQIAKKEGMHKLELTVVADNEVAISLYRKIGFIVEGVSKDSFFGSDGKYHDIVHMGFIL